MSQKIRWGILSTARINNSLLDPIRQSERSELAAVASRNLEKAQAYAAEKDIPQAYGNYESLLADPNIDVIYNPLPNALHCEWSVKAAQAGKSVLCEKPIVTTLAELDQIESAAQDNHVTIFEAFMYLHHPQTLKVKAMIQNGELGKIQLINSWFNFYLPENSGNIRLDPSLAGGSLWDVGVYPNSMSIVMAHAGPPEEVWAQQLIGETGVEVGIRAQLKFSNGVVAQISSGFRSAFRQATFIVGDKATLNLLTPWKPGFSGQDSLIELSTIDNHEETITIPALNPYICEVQAMEACILDGAEPLVPLSLSRDFLHTILAIYQSAQTGQPVSIETQ